MTLNNKHYCVFSWLWSINCLLNPSDLQTLDDLIRSSWWRMFKFMHWEGPSEAPTFRSFFQNTNLCTLGLTLIFLAPLNLGTVTTSQMLSIYPENTQSTQRNFRYFSHVIFLFTKEEWIWKPCLIKWMCQCLKKNLARYDP